MTSKAGEKHYLRKEASLEADIVGTIQRGDIIQVVEVLGDLDTDLLVWVKLSSGAWCLAKSGGVVYLEPVGVTLTPSPTSSLSPTSSPSPTPTPPSPCSNQDGTLANQFQVDGATSCMCGETGVLCARKYCIASIASTTPASSAAIDDRGNNYCQSSNKCSQCQGDCDDDDDCENQLVCFQRTNSEQEVPGCTGDDYVKTSR